MSDEGGGALAAFVAAGVTYWLGYGLALAAVAVLVGAVVAVVIGLGLLIQAVRAWRRAFREAGSIGDRAWRRDLLAAPLAGFVTAAVVAVPLNHWLTGTGQQWVDTHINGDNASLAMQMVPLPFGIVFFALLLALPSTLARDAHRWLAYPGFACYSAYFAAVGVAVATHHL
jgi:hypothetical protein